VSAPRVAVVGCGRMGLLRMEGALRHGASVVAAYDDNADAAAALAAKAPGCRTLSDPGELDWGGVDAVFVCTPPAARGPVETRAAREGRAVFVEKPVGLGAAQLESFRRAASDGAVLTAVGYMNRYRASVREAREALRGAAVLGAAGNWVNASYAVPWWGRRELSGGPVNEQATHLVDLARYLVGEVRQVQAIVSEHPERPGIAGSAAVTLAFDSGVLGSLFYSCRATVKEIGFRVFTADGAVRLDGWDLARVDPDGAPASPAPSADRYQVFHDETAAFLTAVAGGPRDAIRCDLEDAVRTQHVVDAVHRAAASGRTEPVHE
jgi:myo-inositol 2-dehydrogenase/D-chiro-inositol 1-dehydrogenase